MSLVECKTLWINYRRLALKADAESRLLTAALLQTLALKGDFRESMETCYACMSKKWTYTRVETEVDLIQGSWLHGVTPLSRSARQIGQLRVSKQDVMLGVMQ